MITHIDCHHYRGASASLDTSSFVSFNPNSMPGRIVIGGARAIKKSIGSQVACRLSLEHFTDGVLEHFLDEEVEGSTSEQSLRALEAAFKKANKSVYTFGHSLAAGGRMAAAFIGLVIENDFIAAGRVGDGGVYLIRNGEVFPFFDVSDQASHNTDYIGAQSMISVELASVPVENEDILMLFSNQLSQSEQLELTQLVADIDLLSSPNPATEISQFLFQEPKDIAYSFFLKLGPQGVFLR